MAGAESARQRRQTGRAQLPRLGARSLALRHLHESLPLASMTHSRICDEFLFSGQTGSNCSCYFATRSLTRRMSVWPGPQPGCKTLTARDRSFNALVQHPLLQAGACYAATVSQHWCGRERVGDRRPCLLQGSRWGGLPGAGARAGSRRARDLLPAFQAKATAARVWRRARAGAQGAGGKGSRA